MIKKNCKKFFLIFFFLPLLTLGQGKGPLPTKQQLAWHDMEFYLFVHFGPNTFTDKEWGLGDEPEDVFNPSDIDCKQWCRIAKASGAKGIIITAKHHDGFCLWPSKYSTHTVRESKWKNGKGDVLKELSEACKEYGLKFGVYISPWDRNHPKYGTPEYNDVFVNMMKEIFQNYGPIWELWWDGANGEGPNGKKQVYDWRRFENTVRSLSPKTIIFSDIGPDARWCGNEKGIAGKTNWNYLDTAGFTRGIGAPPNDTLNMGNVNGKNWIPAECDVSIRPGWFWHEQEDDKVKTPEQLFTLYLKSVGRGANLLLNVPPNRKGLISPEDSVALAGFKNLRDENFRDNLLKEARAYYEFSGKEILSKGIKVRNFGSGSYGANIPDFTVEFFKPTTINCIILREAIHLGQTVKHFKIQLIHFNKPVGEIEGTTIGRKRILTFPSQLVTSFHVSLDDKRGNDNVSGVAAYLINEKLVEK
ncbi:MAG: alpha-L-fucosidase [Bacteroidetes bacterium]|nr:alpha-L-fucosidase [Bacteroidota bacterium]MBS1931039.1 alpha-L-fucosidase [Bacteroidota bacterium]